MTVSRNIVNRTGIVLCNHDRPYYSKGMCRGCYEKHLIKNNSDYHNRQKDNCNRWRRANKDKKNSMDKQYQLKNRKRISRRNYDKELSQYGLSVDSLASLVKYQDNKCGVCSRDLNKSKTRHVDHDHKTGIARGVLCHKCNLGIGLLGDDINGLERAIDYLNQTPYSKFIKQQ